MLADGAEPTERSQTIAWRMLVVFISLEWNTDNDYYSCLFRLSPLNDDGMPLVPLSSLSCSCPFVSRLIRPKTHSHSGGILLCRGFLGDKTSGEFLGGGGAERIREMQSGRSVVCQSLFSQGLFRHYTWPFQSFFPTRKKRQRREMVFASSPFGKDKRKLAFWLPTHEQVFALLHASFVRRDDE